MSTTINQDVIKAREVVAGYKELNKGTIEEISYYDPVLKLRRYKKVSIDPKSKDFIKLYGKKKNEKEKKGKPLKALPVNNTTKPKVCKPIKVAKPRYVKVTQRKKRAFNPDSQTSLIFKMHNQGKSNKQIADYFDIPQHYVTARIFSRKKSLGLPTVKQRKIDPDEVLKAFKIGKSVKDICDMFNISDSSIYKLIRDQKTDKLRRLERMDVLRVIQAKCKLNQSDHVFGKMITPAKSNYKFDISIMDVYKYCNELAEQGKIIIPDEPLMKHKGRKICLPIA